MLDMVETEVQILVRLDPKLLETLDDTVITKELCIHAIKYWESDGEPIPDFMWLIPDELLDADMVELILARYYESEYAHYFAKRQIPKHLRTEYNITLWTNLIKKSSSYIGELRHPTETMINLHKMLWEV